MIVLTEYPMIQKTIALIFLKRLEKKKITDVKVWEYYLHAHVQEQIGQEKHWE